MNALVIGGEVAVGGQGDACGCLDPHAVNPSAIGGVAVAPFRLTRWLPWAAGVMGNVDPENVFASYGDQVTAAVWDSSEVQGGGRLAVFMDLNWAQSYTQDQVTASQITQNLALFLNGLPAPPQPT